MANKKDLKSLVDQYGYSKPIGEKQLISLIRTAVRKQWMMSPTKLSFIESKKIPETDPNQKKRKHYVICNICKQHFTVSHTQVDHIVGNIPFTDLSQSLTYAQSVLNVCHNDLQILCKPCHEIKTYSEKHNITFKQAKIAKHIIDIFDNKQDSQFIINHNQIPQSNKSKRKQQIYDILCNTVEYQ